VLRETVNWQALVRSVKHLVEGRRPKPIRVLSVEDDPDQAAFIHRTLEEAGHHVRVCREPAQFERCLREFLPDVVLMDILLPGMSGYDLVRYLRQDERYITLPVIFLTAERRTQSRSRSAKAGGDDYLVKPVDPVLLQTIVSARAERARFVKSLLERDGLTSLLTHTALAERAKKAHADKQRHPQRQHAWVMLDLDHFKSINDRFGHPVGDRVLSALSALLRKRLRQTDTIARYGGEEFAVLFEGLSEAQVVGLVDRLREDFAQDRARGCRQVALQGHPERRHRDAAARHLDRPLEKGRRRRALRGQERRAQQGRQRGAAAVGGGAPGRAGERFGLARHHATARYRNKTPNADAYSSGSLTSFFTPIQKCTTPSTPIT
jgi:diguanylate cyclase (GGDEF)-like protein